MVISIFGRPDHQLIHALLCLQPQKVVIALTGKYAGKKAVVVKSHRRWNRNWAIWPRPCLRSTGRNHGR